MILNVKKHALFASEDAQVFLRTNAEATQSKDLSLRIFVIFEDVMKMFMSCSRPEIQGISGLLLSLCQALLSQLHPGCRPATRRQGVCFPLELPFFSSML